MIKVTFVEQTYPAPTEDDDDYCPDFGDAVTDEDTLSFRELVQTMRSYAHPSCSPATGATYEWLSQESRQDYMTGEWTERSMHYSRENLTRTDKYWRLAMRAAGIIK